MAWDVFVSHRWVDKPWVLALVDALEEVGLSCWVDQGEVEPFGPITKDVAKGLAECRALVACYSAEYSKSRVCQWEMTAAHVAGEAAEPASRRVLVVNPEEGHDHIHVGTLADQLAMRASRSLDPADHAELAASIAASVVGLVGMIGEIPVPPDVKWFGHRNGGSDRFVGRLEELWNLHGQLGRSSQAAIHATAAGRADKATLVGMGGIGKSLLAEEYAIRFAGAYPGGIVWLSAKAHADSPGTDDGSLYLELSEACRSAGLTVEAETVTGLKAKLTAHLAADGRALWVIDDLPSGLAASGDRSDLDAWLPPGGSDIATLVTTRSAEYSGVLGGIDLDVLSVADGVELLRLRPELEHNFDEAAARRIVSALGGHALAIDVTAAQLAGPAAPSLAAFADELEDPHDHAAARLGEDLREVLPTGHETSIALTFLRSLEQLDEAGLLVMDLCAELLPRPTLIPSDLIVEAYSHVADNGGDRRAITDCVRLSLLRAGPPDVKAVDIHPITRDVVQAWSSGETSRCSEALLATLERLVPAAAVDAEARQTGGPLVDQAEAFAFVSGRTTREIDLASWVAMYRVEVGQVVAAITAFEEMLADLLRVLGADHPDTLTTRHNLASTYQLAGRIEEAITAHEHVLADRLRVLGADHPDTLTTRSNLASTYWAAGRIEEAIAAFEEVLADSTRVLGADHPDTLTTRSNLAGAYQSAGRIEEAIAPFEEVLADSTRVLGADHANTLTTRSNLAYAYQSAGRIEEAIAAFEEVFADRLRVLGTDHPDTLTNRSILANAYGAAGRVQEAITAHKQVLADSMRVLGTDHPDTLISRNNLAYAYRVAGRIEEAITVFEEVFADQLRVLGANHPDTLTSRHNLAHAYRTAGRVEEAVEILEELVEDCRRLLPPSHEIRRAVEGDYDGAAGHLRPR